MSTITISFALSNEGNATIDTLVSTVISLVNPILIIVAVAGIVYSIVVGVRFVKADTKEEREEAKQKLIAAEAEAKSMAIRANALTQNKALVEYEAVQKWNGVLPTYMMGNSVPFVNLK